jgi:hypothetical protein
MKNIMVSIVILFLIAGLTYFSKPDRVGLDRCQKIFGFDSLTRRGLEESPLPDWSPFENSKI